MWQAICVILALATTTLAVSPEYSSAMIALPPMPDSTDVLRTGSVEQLSYRIAITCPDSGGVLRYHRELLQPQGFVLCTPSVVKWVRSKTLSSDVASYKAIFANKSAGQFIVLDVQCPLTSEQDTGSRQDVSVTTIRDRSLPELKRIFGVTCE